MFTFGVLVFLAVAGFALVSLSSSVAKKNDAEAALIRSRLASTDRCTFSDEDFRRFDAFARNYFSVIHSFNIKKPTIEVAIDLLRDFYKRETGAGNGSFQLMMDAVISEHGNDRNKLWAQVCFAMFALTPRGFEPQSRGDVERMTLIVDRKLNDQSETSASSVRENIIRTSLKVTFARIFILTGTAIKFLQNRPASAEFVSLQTELDRLVDEISSLIASRKAGKKSESDTARFVGMRSEYISVFWKSALLGVRCALSEALLPTIEKHEYKSFLDGGPNVDVLVELPAVHVAMIDALEAIDEIGQAVFEGADLEALSDQMVNESLAELDSYLAGERFDQYVEIIAFAALKEWQKQAA